MIGTTMRRSGYIVLLLLVIGISTGKIADNSDKRPTAVCYVGNVRCSEKDQSAFDAISALHRQIDDDHDGDVDLKESDGFLRDELQYTNGGERQNKFHGKDTKISVSELWKIWKSSEVHNWTVEDTVNWLVSYVELPQYAETFQTNLVDGATLPRLATHPQFISGVLGVKNPVHKQKLTLKAMDVVLFGSPKRGHSYLKDLILVTSLVIAAGGCWFAYVQNQNSKTHLKKMMKDLDILQKAEDSLSELQERLNNAQQEQKNVQEEKLALEKTMKNEIEDSKREAKRLKEQREGVDEAEKRYKLAEEELEHVRALLNQAEQQLEDHQWIPPPELQQWLQLTYEIELKQYNAKKVAAEKQLAVAKEGCDKIRKKRSAFMGSLRIAHSSSIDSIDARISEARTSLEEVRQDLQERLNRWRKIELLCGFPIINNPGISVLEPALKESLAQSPTQTNLSSQGSRRSSAAVMSDLVDTDDEFVAPAVAPNPGAKHHGKFYALGLAAMYATSYRRRQQQAQGIRPRSQSLIPNPLTSGYPNPLGARISPSTPPYTVMPHPMSTPGLSALYHSQPDVAPRRFGAFRGQSEIWSQSAHRVSPPTLGQEIGPLVEAVAQNGDARSNGHTTSELSSPDSASVTFSLGASSPEEHVAEPKYPTTTPPKPKQNDSANQAKARPSSLPVSHSDPSLKGAVSRPSPVTDRQSAVNDRIIPAELRPASDETAKGDSGVIDRTLMNGSGISRVKANSESHTRQSDDDCRSDGNYSDTGDEKKRKHRLNIFTKKDKAKKA